jgi:hypothetical protein
VSLITAKYLPDTSDTPWQFNAETGWQAISRGLGHVVSGYVILIGGSLLGAGLLWLALDGGPLTAWACPNKRYRESVLALGVFTLGLTALLSYGLVLLGQWRCMMHAPQRQKAKELMYICLNCVFLAMALNVFGVIVDGGQSYALLKQGWEGFEKIDARTVGNLAQLGSAGIGLFASLVFSQFLRNVASCFNDRARVRSVDLNLALVGLLLGGSGGTLVWVHRQTSMAEMLPWLVGGWLLCFAWHLWLVNSVRRGVDEGLLRQAIISVLPSPHLVVGSVAMHSLSGLRRLADKANDGAA